MQPPGGVKIPFFHLVGDVIVDIIHHGKMDWLMNRNIEAPTQSDRLVETETRQAAGCQLLFMPMMAHVKHDTKRLEKKTV